MAPRTRAPTGDQVAYQRAAARMEQMQAALSDRLDAQFDRIVAELGELKTDVRRLDQNGNALTNRITDVERQVLDTREEIQRSRAVPAPSQLASAKAAIKDTLSTWQAKATAGTAVVAFILILANNIPDAARFIDRLLAFLSGDAVPAAEVVIPKKDEHG